MKIRNGFVSNSSTSSFVIGVKNCTLSAALKDLEQKELKRGGLFSSLITEAIITIKECANEFNDELVENDYGLTDIDAFLEDGGDDAENIRDLLDKGFKVYIGSFSDDGGEPIEVMLCNTDLNYTSKNLVIIHNGGY